MAYTNQDIEGFYRNYMGRGFSDPNEGQGWLNDPNAEQNIKNSGEAQAWAGRQRTQPAAPPQPFTAPTTRVAGNNGWYTEGTKTYDNNGLLQGDAGYNRAALADALYKLQTSADRGNNLNLDQWLAGHQDIAKGVTSGNGGEYINLPGGGSYDVRRGWNAGSGTGDFVSFGAAGDPGDRNAAIGAGGGDYSGGGGSGSSSSSSFSSTTNPQDSALRDMLIKQLTQRAQQGTKIDANDPNIKQQVDPYAASQDRASRNYLADLAEKSGPLANLQGQARVAAEHAGQNTGLFQAQLIGRELESRRAEIKDALAQMGSMLSDEQKIALQQELAHLDDATKRLGLQYSRETAQGQLQLGQNELGLNYGKFDWERDPSNPNNIPNFNSNN